MLDLKTRNDIRRRLVQYYLTCYENGASDRVARRLVAKRAEQLGAPRTIVLVALEQVSLGDEGLDNA